MDAVILRDLAGEFHHHRRSDGDDLIVLVEAPTLKELAAFVSEKLSVLDTVTGTSTSFVLKRYKQDGVIFEGLAKDDRLVVSP